jgi:predicted transcriptional regulator
MSKTGYSQLPVFSDNKVVGSITEKTIMTNMLRVGDPKKISKWSVEQLMDEAFPRIESSTPIGVISSLLKYSPAVLVTDKGELVGIITKADLIKIIH